MNKEKLEARRKAREEQKELTRIEAEKNQRPVDEITITIEWKKSQMWGHNPNCRAEIKYKESDGTNGRYENSPVYKCSGCGYDKESTVIADVFNAYLKYKLWNMNINQKNCNNGGHLGEIKPAPYGVLCYTDNHPHFGGGIGTSCYYKIAEFIGGKFERVASGKSFDVYKYTDL